MSRELREGLAFLQAVALSMHFLRRVDLDLEAAAALGLPALLERLMVGRCAMRAGKPSRGSCGCCARRRRRRTIRVPCCGTSCTVR